MCRPVKWRYRRRALCLSVRWRLVPDGKRVHCNGSAGVFPKGIEPIVLTRLLMEGTVEEKMGGGFLLTAGEAVGGLHQRAII